MRLTSTSSRGILAHVRVGRLLSCQVTQSHHARQRPWQWHTLGRITRAGGRTFRDGNGEPLLTDRARHIGMDPRVRGLIGCSKEFVARETDVDLGPLGTEASRRVPSGIGTARPS
jgi:hypothetical protein